MGRPTKRKMYSASILSFIIALAFTGTHFYSGWQAEISNAQTHEEQADFSEYLIVWTRDFTENMQSEFYQIGFQFAVLAGVFAVMGVRAYEDDNQEMKESLARIENHLGIK